MTTYDMYPFLRTCLVLSVSLSGAVLEDTNLGACFSADAHTPGFCQQRAPSMGWIRPVNIENDGKKGDHGLDSWSEVSDRAAGSGSALDARD